jgi:hypothetical protein
MTLRSLSQYARANKRRLFRCFTSGHLNVDVPDGATSPNIVSVDMGGPCGDVGVSAVYVNGKLAAVEPVEG